MTPAAATLCASLASLASDVDVLAGVALSEDPLAASAVSHVVLNRARASGTSVLAEAARPGAFHGWSRGLDPLRRVRTARDRAVLARLRAAAASALLGLDTDPTRGATHFHRAGTPVPPWAPPRSTWVRAGSHWFYVGTRNNSRKQRTYGLFLR